MALKKTSEVEVEGGDWLDFKELARLNTAVVFTVRQIEDEVDLGNGPLQPVRARVIILSGPQKGEIHEDERILAAGIRNKLTEVGDDVVGRLRPYGARKAPGLENEEPGDVEAAQAALDHVAAGTVPTQAAAPAAEEKPAKRAAKKEPAKVAAGNVTGDADADEDDDPDF